MLSLQLEARAQFRNDQTTLRSSYSIRVIQIFHDRFLIRLFDRNSAMIMKLADNGRNGARNYFRNYFRGKVALHKGNAKFKNSKKSKRPQNQKITGERVKRSREPSSYGARINKQKRSSQIER